jgi:hypothetical protein
MTRSQRYDPDENVSRHGATDPDQCEDMADKYGWSLVRIEGTGDPMLEVDCVFDGERIKIFFYPLPLSCRQI